MCQSRNGAHHCRWPALSLDALRGRKSQDVTMSSYPFFLIYPCSYSRDGALAHHLMARNPCMLLIDTRLSPRSRWSDQLIQEQASLDCSDTYRKSTESVCFLFF